MTSDQPFECPKCFSRSKCTRKFSHYLLFQRNSALKGGLIRGGFGLGPLPACAIVLSALEVGGPKSMSSTLFGCILL